MTLNTLIEHFKHRIGNVTEYFMKNRQEFDYWIISWRRSTMGKLLFLIVR